MKLSQSDYFPIMDPQGFKASQIVVSGIHIDKAAQTTCKCKPAKGVDCNMCVPDAKLIQGTDSALIMPQAAPNAGGSVARVYYTATVAETGLTCEGYADVCFIKKGGTKKAPQCAPFGSNGATRNAVACA